jgi:hypothetical protein
LYGEADGAAPASRVEHDRSLAIPLCSFENRLSERPAPDPSSYLSHTTSYDPHTRSYAIETIRIGFTRFRMAPTRGRVESTRPRIFPLRGRVRLTRLVSG